MTHLVSFEKGAAKQWHNLAYADAITDTRRDVDDELFARLQRHYDDDTIAELTMIIAWQNAGSRFNRAFRIPSQGFWKT